MKKVISFSLFLLASISILFVFVTACALECDGITMREAVKCFISAGIVLTAAMAGGLAANKEETV